MLFSTINFRYAMESHADLSLPKDGNTSAAFGFLRWLTVEKGGKPPLNPRCQGPLPRGCGAPIGLTEHFESNFNILLDHMSAKMMVTLLALALCTPAAVAAPLASFGDAWIYISAKNRPERWVVVRSKGSRDGYFQCENLGSVVRCDVPVWIKRLPGRGRYLPFGGRSAPYPDVAGSQLQEILNQARLAKAEAVLKAQGRVPFFIYGQIKNEQREVVGTYCDLRVMVPFTYTRFEELGKNYLKEVFDAPEASGYELETDG